MARASKWGFIYSITNKETNKIYIGSTNRPLHARWLEHQKRLRNGNHVNLALQKDYDDHPMHLRNFAFKLVEKCEAAKTDEREQFWLDEMKRTNRVVYNTGDDATTTFKNRTHSDATRDKISATLKNTLAQRKMAREQDHTEDN